MKIKKIQQIKVYFVNDDSPQWFWIEPFTNFDDRWIWAFDGEADHFSPLYKINTSNITYICFEKSFRTYGEDGKRDYSKDDVE